MLASIQPSLVAADMEMAERDSAGVGDVVGLGERSRPSSVMIACWICALGPGRCR